MNGLQNGKTEAGIQSGKSNLEFLIKVKTSFSLSEQYLSNG